jgi:hypothetical protein
MDLAEITEQSLKDPDFNLWTVTSSGPPTASSMRALIGTNLDDSSLREMLLKYHRTNMKSPTFNCSGRAGSSKVPSVTNNDKPFINYAVQRLLGTSAN